jgi:hypothetical protein
MGHKLASLKHVPHHSLRTFDPTIAMPRGHDLPAWLLALIES